MEPVKVLRRSYRKERWLLQRFNSKQATRVPNSPLTEAIAMRALAAGLLALTICSTANAQRSAESLPAVTVDCYQSFGTKTQLPEGSDKDVSVAHDDLGVP